jgi:hypothetical protein
MGTGHTSTKHPLSLIGGDPRGEGQYVGQCAALIQFEVPALMGHHVQDWMPGLRVKGRSIRPGTAIAIFDSKGVYLGQKGHDFSHGKAHAALYVRQSEEGIEVVHQFRDCGKIRGTLVRFGGCKLRQFDTTDFTLQALGSQAMAARSVDNTLPDHRSGVSKPNTSGAPIIFPEDDADNYYVVELRPKRK